MSEEKHHESLEDAARQGPLPGVEEADEVARQGREESAERDAEAQAEEAGDETVPGGIAMGHA